MKVEISIDRETKVYELQTIAEFAANLAIRKSREEGGQPAAPAPAMKPNISEDKKKFEELTKDIPGVKSEETVIDSSSEANNVEAIIDDKSAVEEVFDGNQEAKKAVGEVVVGMVYVIEIFRTIAYLPIRYFLSATEQSQTSIPKPGSDMSNRRAEP